MSAASKNLLRCYHCGEDCNGNIIVTQSKSFCCEGCKLVYEILNENNLCTYYDLNEQPGVTQKIKIRENKFSFLEDRSIQEKIIQFSDAKQTHVTFYLPQMHCSSCLWLLENIHRINKAIVSSKVNFIKKEVFIVYDNSSATLRNIVETLTSIGYEPYLSLQELNPDSIQYFNKSKLYKIGISGFCFANIMMMSFPEYLVGDGVIEESIKNVLRYLVLALSIPVLFYCASDFFISAWKGIRHKYLNIDAPIALAVLITFLRSLYEMFVYQQAGYFDSMSGIVFFMLVGRYLQDKTHQSISFDRDYKSFFPIAVNVLKEGKMIPASLHSIKTGDVIQVYNNELIPVDGILSKGIAEIDYSFVSGESIPVTKQIGEIIYAGGKQLSGVIELLVVKEVSQSYLTNLWNKDIFKHKQTKTHSFINSLSTKFTLIVLLIATTAATYWLIKHDYQLMWNTLTTVLIVACPCTLLLAATFTNNNLLNIFSRNKFYLRHPDVIENISNINHVVFDKTGTITQNNTIKVAYKGVELNSQQKQATASLLMQSSHPLSKAITTYLNISTITEIENFKTIQGKGIEAWVQDSHYKIGSSEFVHGMKDTTVHGSIVYLMIDNSIIGQFNIVNQYRFGFNQLAKELKNKFSLSILSGDNNAEQKYLTKLLGESTEMLFHQKPEEKLAYIQHLQNVQHKNVMMIGDGLNDAGALKQSNVGIAVSEDSNNFSPASDAILDASQFSNLFKFIQLAKAGKKIIIACFAISFIYNFIGLYYAVQGMLSPFIAAILMPCSSVSIILITYTLTKITAWKLHLTKYDKSHALR